MAPWTLSGRSADLLQRILRLFLPVSGAITLVLLPMVTLYEHTRRQTVEARVSAQVQAATLGVQTTLLEARANTGVVTTVPALQALIAAPAPSAQLRRQMEAVFKGQLREYDRFSSLAVYGSAGQLLAQVNRVPVHLPDALRRRVLAQAEALQAGQISLSPVLWPAQGPAALLLARPLFSSKEQRRGVLLAVITLAPLARDFDRITNADPALERGFLLSGEGRAVNAPPGGTASLNFAARYPQVWQQIQRQPKGVVNTDQGLFVYLTDRLRSPAQRGSGQGLFVYDRGPAQQPLVVVIQVPPPSLYRTSAFAQPSGQALVALLYLLAAGASVAIARQQTRVAESRLAERQSKARLQAILGSAGVGMCLCDPQSGRFLTVNNSLCAFFCRSEDELLRCTWQELTHPDDLEADQLLAAQLHRGEFDQYRLRKRFRRPDGSTVWGDLVVSCNRNTDGTVRDLIGQITDISELVAKTSYLEAASSAGVVGVWDWDVAGNRLTWDAVMFRLYGLAPDQRGITYAQWEEAVHPDDRSQAVQALNTALAGGQPYDCQFRVIWPDHSVHDIRARGIVELSSDGEPLRVVGVNYDITDQMRKTRYVEAASSAGVIGVWDWDVPSDLLTWDAVMVRLYGLRAEDFQGTRQAWEQAVHPDDKPFVLQELQAALRGWREYQPRFRVVWPDGSIHHLQARSRTTFGPDGRPLRMIGVNYDITEQVEREEEIEQQRQLLATTLDALVDPLLVLTLDDRQHPRGVSPPELCIAELNPAAARFFARSQPQLLGRPLTAVLPASRNSELIEALQAVARGGPSLLADAQPVWLEQRSEMVLPGDLVEPLLLDLCAVALQQGLVLSFRDVSEQRRTTARLAASEERYRLLAENASDVVFRASLDGVTEWITDSVTPLVGWAPADLIQRPFAPFVHPDDMALLQEVDAAFSRGERRQFRLRVQRRDGDYHWISVNARGMTTTNGEVVGIIGSWRDAQTEVEAEAELDRRARIDPLTGLYNRQEILEQLVRLTQRRQHPAQRHRDDGALAVLFCDIDHFKEINDHHGHGGGDAVLQALAQRLRASTRLGDLVGRIGGDELLVVLQSVPSLEVALEIAHKMHAAARQPLQLPTGVVVPTLSIGVTLIQPEEAIDAVVARADAAMYEAKQGGRDRVIAFS